MTESEQRLADAQARWHRHVRIVRRLSRAERNPALLSEHTHELYIVYASSCPRCLACQELIAAATERLREARESKQRGD